MKQNGNQRPAVGLMQARPAGTSHLIVRPNWTNDPDASIELEEFLEQALTAANTKARELGWIV